jgi:DNA adenine methylase
MDIPILSELRPPLKWAGGKRWLVPYLRPIWMRYRDRRLVEPFCGGLAVTLNLLPERAILNDINPHLIAFYRRLRQGFAITMPLRHNEQAYYAARARFNELIRLGQEGSEEAATLFYYLNRTGYNGLCRFNRRGEFNVPFGQYKQINYMTDFSAYRATFAQWDFTLGDFAEVQVEPGDMIYADPPYDVEFTQYSKEIFGWEEQERLATWLAKHTGPVILSNQATERIVKLYKRLGFTLEFHDAPRRINNTGDRTPAREVLAITGV